LVFAELSLTSWNCSIKLTFFDNGEIWNSNIGFAEDSVPLRMLSRVDWYINTDVSKDCDASFFSGKGVPVHILLDPEYEGTANLLNSGVKPQSQRI
jgi:hypothetical protein